MSVTDHRTGAPPARRRRWGLLVAVGVPTLLFAGHAARYGQWIEDDAGITFGYARSLATGAGPVLQPGAEPVEGFSNPAWLAVLVAGKLLRLFDTGTWFGVPDLVAYPKAVALLCCAGVFGGLYAAARAVSAHPVLVTVAAGSLTAAVPSFVIWAVSGLENGLTALLVTALAAVLVRAAVAGRLLDVRVAVACGGLAGLVALTRPDGLVYAAGYPLAVLLLPSGRRGTGRPVAGSPDPAAVPVADPAAVPVAVSLGTAAVPVAGYLAWRLAVFGDWLPNTARAKEQALPTLDDLDRPSALVGYAGWSACLVAAGLVAVALYRRTPTRTAVAALLIPLGLAVLAYVVLAPDWMAQYRFATPMWPLAALATALAAADVLGGAPLRVRLGMVALAAAVTGLSLAGWQQRSEGFTRAPTVTACYIARNTGYTFNTYADVLGVGAQGSLLAVDGGGTSLTSRLRFVDLSGLADRRIARYWQADDMAGLRDHVFDEVRPTFLRVWSGWAELERSGLQTDPRFDRDYLPVWVPADGGGNYVRRDAATDRARLAELRALAPALADVVDAPYARDPMRWWCPEVLRPSAPGTRPGLRLPG